MRIAQSLQQDWLRVGVRVRLRPLAWGVFLEAIREQGRVPMFLLGWEADFPDASNFLDVLFHSRQIGSNNHTEYRNRSVDALLEQAAAELSPPDRIQLLSEAERIVVEDAPWVFLFHPSSFVAVQPRVRGFRLHPWRPPRIGQVRLAPLTR
jgi:peptide/nickel transport system substrate-binding protein/oligopeptide transport system substrate-binding protein